MTNVKQFAELRERLTLWNLAPRRGRWASGNGESVPQGNVDNGGIRMYALSSFSLITPLKYTMQLDPTHQHHHSVICGKTLLTKSQTQLDADQKSRND